MNKINKNRNIDDILLNHKNLMNCELNSKDYMILMGIVQRSTICDISNPFGGQVASWTVDVELEKEGLQRNTINYSIKKLLKYNILIKNTDEMYFQLNPYYVWIPSNPDAPTLTDKASYEYLKSKFK